MYFLRKKILLGTSPEKLLVLSVMKKAMTNGQYVGNSKLKVVRYRGQRKYGNKALPVLPTEDEIFALEEKIKEIVQNTDLDDFDSVQVSINDLARIIHERAHRRCEKLQKEAEIEAEELINNAKRQKSHVERNRRGASAKEVNIEQWHKGGRRPIVKPYSEGFEELPLILGMRYSKRL